MTLVTTLPWLFALAGLLVYALTSHKQLGIVMFGSGLLVALYALSGHMVRL